MFTVHYLLTSKSVMEKTKHPQTKRTTKDVFLKRVTPPQEEPEAGPSGGLPVDIVIRGDDSFMHVTALTAYQGAKTWRWKAVMNLVLRRPRLMCVFASHYNKNT